jgi:hypothetical protein
MARYEIQIAAAPNSVVVWIPSELHETSLQNVSPQVAAPNFFQKDMSFVPSQSCKYNMA